jgi:hypothetical protein
MMNRLSPEDVLEMSAQNAKHWMASRPEYLGCPFNSVLMDTHIATQVGRQYVWTWENYEAAYEFLDESGVLQIRPVEASQDEIDAVQEQALRQQIQDEHLTRQAARLSATVAEAESRLKQQPVSVLRTLANVERHKLKGAPRETPQAGRESRQAQPSTIGQARLNVAIAHPLLNRGSAEFSKLVQEEISKNS